jgi:hypothetical protein
LVGDCHRAEQLIRDGLEESPVVLERKWGSLSVLAPRSGSRGIVFDASGPADPTVGRWPAWVGCRGRSPRVKAEEPLRERCRNCDASEVRTLQFLQLKTSRRRCHRRRRGDTWLMD